MLAFTACPKVTVPTVFMMTNPLPLPDRKHVVEGVACVSATDNRWLRCDIKSISLIGNVLLRQASADAGAAETILFRDYVRRVLHQLAALDQP